MHTRAFLFAWSGGDSWNLAYVSVLPESGNAEGTVFLVIIVVFTIPPLSHYLCSLSANWSAISLSVVCAVLWFVFGSQFQRARDFQRSHRRLQAVISHLSSSKPQGVAAHGTTGIVKKTNAWLVTGYQEAQTVLSDESMSNKRDHLLDYPHSLADYAVCTHTHSVFVCIVFVFIRFVWFMFLQTECVRIAQGVLCCVVIVVWCRV